MNETVSKFLLEGDHFMPELHFRQSTAFASRDKPGFTYSSCGPFTKNKEGMQKFKEKGDSRYIYQNDPDKAMT